MVTKETIIIDVLNMDAGTEKIFLAAGMHCLRCPVASQETLEQACMVHGVDVDKLIEDLNEYLNSKGL